MHLAFNRSPREGCMYIAKARNIDITLCTNNRTNPLQILSQTKQGYVQIG